MGIDTTRAGDLRTAKRRATGLLVVVAAAFVAVTLATDGDGAAGYLQATLEAAMVGGLADWFAVVAIFRRPLGLPLPHVAVIPARKEAFGRTLGDFLANNFLQPDLITERLDGADVVPKMGRWLAEPANAQKVADRIVDVGIDLVELVKPEQVERFVEHELRAAAARIQLGPVTGRALRQLTAKHRLDTLIDAVIPSLAQFLASSHPTLREKFRQGAPWWLPRPAHLFDRLVNTALETLEEVAADPGHPLRTKLADAIDNLALRLQTSPEWIARAEAWKDEILADPAVTRIARSLADGVRATVVERAAPGGDLRAASARLVAGFGERVLHDPALADRIRHGVNGVAGYLAEKFGGEIPGLVENGIRKWDGQEAAARLEFLLGKDLQFIRINGTVVGGLAGLLIHTVGELIG
jgi:uncharacterized membrane-anchored protein YjiN (DUF445 family)